MPPTSFGPSALDARPEPHVALKLERFCKLSTGVDVDQTVSREGFGMELLRRSLPYDLQGETRVELAPGGLRFELRMPLPVVNA